MKKIASITAVLMVFFLASCTSNGQVKNVSPQEFKQLSENEPGIILDVRTPGEVAEGVIPGAVTIDWLGDDFEGKVKALDKSKPIYVYCKSGGRSSSACAKMDGLGFTEVYNLSGGIMAWENAGFKTASPNISKGEE